MHYIVLTTGTTYKTDSKRIYENLLIKFALLVSSHGFIANYPII